MEKVNKGEIGEEKWEFRGHVKWIGTFFCGGD